MKKLSFFRVVSLLIITVLVFSGMAIAEDTQAAEIEFSVTESADDIVELSMTVKNATFMGVQTALRYDKDVLVPVNGSGEQTTEFADFAERNEEALFFKEIGLELDAENGLFGFTYYIMPGERAERVNEAGEYLADGEGITICSFRFKRISDENYHFEIASKDENKPYQKANEEGVIILNYTNALVANVIFIYPDKESEQVTITAPVPSVSEPEKTDPEFTVEDRKSNVICMQIGRSFAIAYGEKTSIDPDNNLVVPYISGSRTLVPIRFVAETLGAEVLWEEGWDGCKIKKGDKEIELTFGSAEFKVNGEKVTFDAPVELVQDRTMVPIRFVSEQLGCDVYWNDLNKAVVISPADNPWEEKREAEITALNEMLVTILGLLP